MWTLETNPTALQRYELTKSMTDGEIDLKGYNDHRADRKRRGRKKATYFKTNSICILLRAKNSFSILLWTCVTQTGYSNRDFSRHFAPSLDLSNMLTNYESLLVTEDINWLTQTSDKIHL